MYKFKNKKFFSNKVIINLFSHSSFMPSQGYKLQPVNKNVKFNITNQDQCKIKSSSCDQPTNTQNSSSSIKIGKHLQEENIKLQLANKNSKSYYYWSRSRKHIQECQNKGRTLRHNHSIWIHQGPRAPAIKLRGNNSQLRYAPIIIT